MIRRVALALLALLVAGGAAAQTPRPPYPYGFRAGFNFLNATAAPPPSASCTLADPSTIFGSVLVAWWDGSDTTTFTQSGSSVSQWTSKGTGISATQGTVAQQPTYNATARNGRPGLVFSSSFMQFPTSAMPTGATPSSIFVGGYTNTNGQDGGVFGWGLGQSAGWRSIAAVGTTSTIRAGIYGTDINVSKSWATTDLFVQFDVGSTSVVYVDNVQSGSANTSPNTVAGNGYIGAFPSGNARLTGVVQQIVVTNRLATATERELMSGWESWADGKAGSNLQASNRFKSRAPCTTD